MNSELFNFLLYIFYGQAARDEIETYLVEVFNKSGGNPVQFISTMAEYISNAKKITSVNTREVIDATVTMYEGITNTTLFPADPVRLFLSTMAAIVAQQNANIDYYFKQNFLRYANGIFLDRLGEFLAVVRADALPAKTIIKFSLAALRNQATAIPEGTRVTADGKIFFATDALVIIPADKLSVEVSATCLTQGIIGNGLAAGKLNRIVDPIAFVTGAENINKTNGGTDIETDESLRNRIRLKPESFTTAGSEMAYIYWALTAHSNIGDVSVVSPIPGYVNLFIMLRDGKIPEQDSAEMEAVKKIFGVSEEYGEITSDDGKKLRPLTDFITIYPINVELTDYTITWFITGEQGTHFNEIQQLVNEAVAEYEIWQTARAGRDIVPDKLIQLCRAAGAKRIVLNGLDFTVIDNSTVVKFWENPDRIIFGGVERE